MKTLLLSLALVLAAPVFACDSQGSGEDCDYDHPQWGGSYWASWPDSGGGGVTCDALGCSGSWIRETGNPIDGKIVIVDPR